MPSGEQPVLASLELVGDERGDEVDRDHLLGLHLLQARFEDVGRATSSPTTRSAPSPGTSILAELRREHLLIGRALMLRPRLMLLDEPSLGLSPILVHEIAEIVKRLNEEQGVTMLLVEQNAKMALDLGDYGYVMENGRIVMEDTCERLKNATDIKEFYLGMKNQGVRGRRRWKQRKTWR